MGDSSQASEAPGTILDHHSQIQERVVGTLSGDTPTRTLEEWEGRESPDRC